MQHPKSIVITGGSSGIGLALARHYAAPGVTIAITGRDVDRIAAAVADLKAAGANAEGVAIDVTDRDAMADWLLARDDAANIDLVIANAGVANATSGVDGAAADRRVLAVNVDGVLNTVEPLLARMQSRGRGQIAVMSSLAGFRGLPGAAAYSASKAAVRVYAESLQDRRHGPGVKVAVICPGFVDSRITQQRRGAMPFFWDSERAARHIARRLAAGHRRIAFPLPMYALVWMLAALPTAVAAPLIRRYGP